MQTQDTTRQANPSQPKQSQARQGNPRFALQMLTGKVLLLDGQDHKDGQIADVAFEEDVVAVHGLAAKHLLQAVCVCVCVCV